MAAWALPCSCPAPAVNVSSKTMGPTDACGHVTASHGSVEVVEELCHPTQLRMLLGQANTTDSFSKLTKASPCQEAVCNWINA